MYLVLIIPTGMLKKQEVVEALNKTQTDLRVKRFSHWLQVNNVRCRQIIRVSGLRFPC